MTTLINRPNTALLVVDMQVGVVAGLTAATRSSRPSPPSWTRRAAPGSTSSGCSTTARNSRRGSDGWQYVPELARRDAEPLVAKEYSDAFEATELESVLADRGIGRFFLAGAQTDECIRSTLHGAITRGYDVTLVADAHTTEDLTEWARRRLNSWWPTPTCTGSTTRPRGGRRER